MTNPPIENAPTIQLGEETYVMRFGVRALHELGVNPFQPAKDEHGNVLFNDKGQPKSAVGVFLDEMTIKRAAEIVRACILHEFSKRGPRHGQEPPTVEDIIDDLDFAFFEGTIGKLLEASGLIDTEGAQGPQRVDPQAA